jgi:ATP-dependent RNA helicase DDX27
MGLLGLQVCELHGNLSQTQRIQAFMDFKEGKYEYMLATDLAARGLDIKEVKTVINY